MCGLGSCRKPQSPNFELPRRSVSGRACMGDREHLVSPTLCLLQNRNTETVSLTLAHSGAKEAQPHKNGGQDPSRPFFLVVQCEQNE